MIPDIGQLALIFALLMAVYQAILPMVSSFKGFQAGIATARYLASGQFIFLCISFACLTYAFLTDDFSVKYVASTSNLSLPVLYKISGVWGAHEGSLLLWALILSLWTVAVCLFSRDLPAVYLARVISVMGFISVGFLIFLLALSNPFEKLPFTPADGRSLNPLLQDPGLAIHPPMLYMGYVGFCVAFAFAISALISGKIDALWVRWVRPWTNIAWCFLTIGITLGSWWAYYELGWGGWWFWDPVENASLLPWLVGTALIHSLAVTEKRGAFKSWTVLLAISSFSLSLLGTFLVRSGVLTSVHAFATDPSRGLYILCFLIIVVGTSFLLYAWRSPSLKSESGFHFISRETGLLVNNIFLVTIAACVLLGTLYPLILDALDAGKISVGPPYFNAVIVPIALAMFAVMAIGFSLRWKNDSFSRIFKRIRILLVFALIAGLVLPSLWLSSYNVYSSIGLTLASLIALVAVTTIYQQKKSYSQISGSVWGASIAHIGMAITIAGISITAVYSHEKDIRLSYGENYEIAGYSFKLIDVTQHAEKNYQASTGLVEVFQKGQLIAQMKPEKRVYDIQNNPMTEAAIDAGFFRDLFVALGEPLGASSWSLRIYHKPFIRWIWLGALLMALGAAIAVADRRYRKTAART